MDASEQISVKATQIGGIMNKKDKRKDRYTLDLVFPSVVLDSTAVKDRRRRRKWKNYRFYAILLLLLVLVFYFIDHTILQVPLAETKLDLSNVKKIKDLSVEAVESWCLEGDEHDTCGCHDPLIPEGRQEDERWEKVHHLNRKNFANRRMDDVDVIFLGDSITEGWRGTFYNLPDTRVKGADKVFRALFSKAHGARYEAMTQGISADTTSNLLWRIQNGEIGSSAGDADTHDTDKDEGDRATPLVFWVLIGTNDLANFGCSADMVVLGILRVVEELRLRQPSAWVVINGLLPRTSDHTGFLMQSKGKSPTLWPVIRTINKELERYATKRERVEYFESKVFFQNATAPDEELRLEQGLMNDFLHPNAAGYRLWGREIVKKLDSLQSVLMDQ